MKKRDRLIKNAGISVGLTLVHSNNTGGWSKGVPYTTTDIEFDPLYNVRDAIELATNLCIDIPIKKNNLTLRKVCLYVTIKAAAKSKVWVK